MRTRPKSRRLVPRCSCGDNTYATITPAEASPEQAVIAPSHLGASTGLAWNASGKGAFGFTEYTGKR